MNGGLTFLLGRYFAGRARHLRRQLRGSKGRVIAAGIVLLALFILLPRIITAFEKTTPFGPAARESVRLIAPVVMFTLAALSVLTGWGIHFRPAEIDWLFSAPISRRALLLYNLASRVQALALASVWMAIFFTPYARTWYAAFLAAFTAQTLVHVSSQCAGLALATATAGVSARVRRRLALLALVLPAGLLVSTGGELPDGAVLLAHAEVAVRSPVVGVMTAPFVAPVEVFLAPGLLGTLAWTAVGLLTAAALAYLMTRLDAASGDASLRASVRVEERLARFRKGASTFGAVGRGRVLLELPHLPYWGGAGPIAWRQLTDITRNLNTILFTVGFLGFFFFIAPMIAAFFGVSSRTSSRSLVTAFTAILILGGTVSLTQHLGFDFRRDLDRLVYVRALPIRPFALALGQLLPSSLLFTLIQALALAVLALATGAISPRWYAALVMPLFPLNWMVVAIDNWMFLYVPDRITPSGPGDFQALGRTAIVMILKTVSIGIGGGLGGALAIVLWRLSGGSPPVAAVGVTVVLLGFGLLLTYLVARAFEVLDVSRDIPG